MFKRLFYTRPSLIYPYSKQATRTSLYHHRLDYRKAVERQTRYWINESPEKQLNMNIWADDVSETQDNVIICRRRDPWAKLTYRLLRREGRMLDCRLSSVLWHLEISSSRRSDQRLVIPNHFMRNSLIHQGMNKILRTSQLSPC